MTNQIKPSMNKQLLTLLMSAALFTSCKKSNEAKPTLISLKKPTHITYAIKSDSLNQDGNINYVAFTPDNLQKSQKIVYENLLENEYGYVIERPDTGTTLTFTGKQVLKGGHAKAQILIDEEVVAEYVSPSGAGSIKFTLSYKF